MDRRTIANEPRPGLAFRDVVVLLGGERLNLIRAGFDGGGFAVNLGVGMMRLHQADVVEQELVAARRAELASLEVLRKLANPGAQHAKTGALAVMLGVILIPIAIGLGGGMVSVGYRWALHIFGVH